MDVLHDSLLKHLAEVPTKLVLALIERKLGEKGVILDEAQRSAVQRALATQDWSGLVLPIGDQPTEDNIELHFDASDVTDIENRVQKLLTSLPTIINPLSAKLAVDIRKALDAKWPKEERHQGRDIKEFRQRLRLRWREPLSGLRQLIVIATELGESVNHRLRNQHPVSRPFTIEVQTRLHARACQIANEVVALLTCGFAEGAIARWRSLHEVAVVSMLIGGNEELAERYRLHEVVESLRGARLYSQYTERLGLEPLPDGELEKLEESVRQLKQRFGIPYVEQYGWAAETLKNPRPTFEHIEAAANVSHLRPYYKLASHSVHANPKGAFFRLGLADQAEVLLAGPSNYGLADAGQNAALSLVHVTSSLTLVDPTLGNIVALKIALALSDDVGQLFVKVQREIEREDEAPTGPESTPEPTGS